MTPGRLFRIFAVSEAITWTLLLGGLAIRAIFGAPPVLLTVVGGIHGAVFLGYGVIAALVGVNNRWGLWRTVGGIALAIVPYATIPFELRVAKSGLLVGAWRREVTSDPRDQHWFDRLFRWFLNRPILLAVVLVTVIVAIFASLLIIGPPGGWPSNES